MGEGLVMKKVFSMILALCFCVSCIHFSAFADEDYPNPDTIDDAMYRSLTATNDIESEYELRDYQQNVNISLVDKSIVYYSPKDEDNRLYCWPIPDVNAGATKKIEIRMKVPVAVNEIVLYFAHIYSDGSADWSEERTFHITDITPSDDFQSFYINTGSNTAWNGTIGKYGITIKGGVGQRFELDYVHFLGDYKTAYTEDERQRAYEFDTTDYGFDVNEYVSEPVPYNSELWIKSAGPEAAITTKDGFEMNATEIPRINIAYKNQTSGTKGKLYFKTSQDEDYSDDRCYELNLTSGQEIYKIDTTDNSLWKGKITGLKFVPSDKEGILRIGHINLEKFDCSISLSDGKIIGKGNLYGKTGSINVKARNTETGEIDYTGTFDTDTDGNLDFSFEIQNENLIKPVKYDLIFTSDEIDGEYKKSIVYVYADYANDIFNKINAARMNNDAALLKTLIEGNYDLLQLNTQHYESFAAKGQYTDEFYNELLGKTASDWNDFEKQLDEAVVTVQVRHMSTDEWIKAVDDYDDCLKFKELSAYKTYEPLTDEIKKEIAVKMNAEQCKTIANAREAFGKNVITTALKHAVAWGDVKNILQTNSELISLDFGAVNSLKTPSEAYRQLTEKSFSTLAEVKDAFDKAVSDQKKKESSSGTSGGSSGGGGGSSSSSGKGSFGIGSNDTVLSPTVKNTPAPTQTPTVTEPDNEVVDVFGDLDGYEWAKRDIENLYQKDIVSGTGDGNFEPSREVKREEFVKMLVSALDLTLSNDLEFTDVNKDEWYANYIGAAVKAELVYGQGTEFGIGQAVSRQDVAVMVARALDMNNSTDENGFEDFDAVADYAKTAVSALAEENILNGYDDGTFRPQSALTRAEAAVIINKVVGRIDK